MATKTLNAATPERELLTINGRYMIAPTTTREEMLNDIGCLLESCRSVIDAVIEGISEEGSQMAANASKDVPRILYGVLYQLEMVGNLAAASFPTKC